MNDPQNPKDEKTKQDTHLVFMGPTPDKEASVEKFSIIQSQNTWDRRTESEYMERVREKATLRVQAMLNQAKTNAETVRKTARQWAEKVKEENDTIREQTKKILQEAEEIKAQAIQAQAIAHEEGLRKGLEQSMHELTEHRNILNATTASVLKTIEGQCSIIFENWRLELVELLKVAVEATTGWLLSKEYPAILENLLSSAIQKLENQKQIIIRINKEDKETIGNVITFTKEKFPELKAWNIKLDPSLNKGDIIVESISGIVENRLSIRQEEVLKIIEQLTIPESSIEKTSSNIISSTIESTGINAISELEKQNLEQTSPEIQSEKEALSTEQEIETTSSVNSHEISKKEHFEELEEFFFPELEGIELPEDNPVTLYNNQAPTVTTPEKLLSENLAPDISNPLENNHHNSPNIQEEPLKHYSSNEQSIIPTPQIESHEK